MKDKEETFKGKIEKLYKQSAKFRSDGNCPVQDMLAPTSDKWSLFIIYNLAYNGTMRFGALQKRISGISSRMLSVTLKKLTASGIVRRQVFAEVPPRTEYGLTDFGMEYARRLIDINLWLASAGISNLKG